MYIVVLSRGLLQSHFEEVAFLVYGLVSNSGFGRLFAGAVTTALRALSCGVLLGQFESVFESSGRWSGTGVRSLLAQPRSFSR
jgi:hypothetical protein